MDNSTSNLTVVENNKNRDIRKLMKLLRTNHPLYLHGIRISYLGGRISELNILGKE